MSVDFSKVYALSQLGKRGAFCASVADTAPANEVTARLVRLFRGEELPASPVAFRWGEGSRLYDLLLSTIPSYVASARFFDALVSTNATGWSRFPIELHGKAGGTVNGYGGLVVTGRCGRPQYERSRVETRIGSSGKPYKVKIGLYFDEASWDGSDVFTAEGSTFVFVTEKVKRALEKAKITGLEFTPLSEFERMW